MATDRLGLNDSQLFAQIELNSKKFRGLRDILEYKNDTLYIWNDNTSEILTLVIQDKIDRNSPFQVCHYDSIFFSLIKMSLFFFRHYH